jgi:hypothetical protein
MSFSKRNNLIPEPILQTKDFDKKSREHFTHYLIDSTNLENIALIAQALTKIFVTEYNLFRIDEFEKRCLINYVKPFNRITGYNKTNLLNFFGSQEINWHFILEFCELLLREKIINSTSMVSIFNQIGWGFTVTTEGHIIQTIEPIELDSINETLSMPDKWGKIKTDFSNAVASFSARPNPNYQGACANASNALDSLARMLTTKTKKEKDKIIFSDWIKENNPKFTFPDPIRWSAEKIYAVDGETFGHGKIEPTHAFTQWYLVNCSSIINWIIQQDK